MASPKSPYVSNNGLHVTGRTSQSVTLAWPVEEIAVIVIVSEPEADKGTLPTKTTKANSKKVMVAVPEPVKKVKVIRVQNGNWYEVQMKRGEHSSTWDTIYRGYGDKLTEDGLPPDSVLVFRMKREKESEWGTQVVASTDPTPASAEDFNKAVEMNSEYLVARILGNTKSSHLRKLLAAHDRNGMTPLMVACHNGNIGIAEKLLSVGCDINGLSSGGRRTPLMFACIMGRKTVVMLLDQHGADWKARDGCGCNVLDYSINNGSLPLVKLAYSRLGSHSIHRRDSMTGWTPLMRAVIVSSSLEIVRFLLAKGADVNSVDRSNDKSVLMAAVLRKKPDLVRFLLNKGANPFYDNVHGRNCFQVARGLEYREIWEILKDHKESAI